MQLGRMVIFDLHNIQKEKSKSRVHKLLEVALVLGQMLRFRLFSYACAQFPKNSMVGKVQQSCDFVGFLTHFHSFVTLLQHSCTLCPLYRREDQRLRTPETLGLYRKIDQIAEQDWSSPKLLLQYTSSCCGRTDGDKLHSESLVGKAGAGSVQKRA